MKGRKGSKSTRPPKGSGDRRANMHHEHTRERPYLPAVRNTPESSPYDEAGETAPVGHSPREHRSDDHKKPL